MVLIAGVAMLLGACGPPNSSHADSQRTGGTATAQSIAAKFTLADFANMRWLEGDWRGTTSSGKPFYESYRMVNDSTMHMGGFADSAFRTQTDSAVIALRGGQVLDQGDGTPWAATHLDSHFVNFGSMRTPANHFAWRRQSADRWEALIFTTDHLGHEQRIVYAIQRVKR